MYIDGGYPVEIYDDAYSAFSMRRRIMNIRNMSRDVYKSFADIAEQEGFIGVAPDL